jgi:membrane fusion protein, multidrug efflux system
MRRLLVPGLALLAACSSGGGGAAHQGAGAPVPVTVARAVQKDTPVVVRAIGTVEAYSTVAVKSQLDGQLARVLFAEGQEVRHDDVLFQIDARPFAAALRQAEANLARDRAQAENARVEAGRLERLLREGVVSKDEHDQVRTRSLSAAAVVAADAAAVERARIDLEYCTIRSPIEGRVGQVLVHEGNVVKENDTTLAVINQLRPVYVSFAVPQQELATIRRYMAGGALPVEATVPSGDGQPVAGELVFVNNTVDQTTGTILLKGRFANPDERLWPGVFVDVSLHLTTERGVTVIPAKAVQIGQNGKYVFVVKEDGTVESRPVETGETSDQDVVVQQGVAPGEEVVTEGQLRLAPGSHVEVKEEAA